jgi:hypothetical protein
MSSALGRVLFPRHAAFNLAVMRILVGCFAAWVLWTFRASTLQTCMNTPDRFFEPLGVLAFMSAPLNDRLFHVLHDVCLALTAPFVLGLFSRLLAPLYAVLLLVVLTYRQSWGFIYHTENLLVLHVLVLGLSRSADVLSLDAWLRSRAPRWLAALCARAPALPSWRYGWPARLMILVTGVTYWVAGMAKLGTNGVAWITDAHLLDHIGNNALRYLLFADGASPLTYHVYAWPPWLWVALGLGSITLELIAPLAVLGGRISVVLAFGLWTFHWGILLLMGIPFAYQLSGIAYAPYVRWDRALSFVRRRARSLRRSHPATHRALDRVD